MSLITPEDFEASGKVLDILIQAGKWLGGTIVAAWIAIRWTVKSSMDAGNKLRQYEEMREDLIVLKAERELWLTRKEHKNMQQLCRGEIEKMIDDRLHAAILEWKDELSALNANICHIMGALNIRPVDQGKRRRRADVENGD